MTTPVVDRIFVILGPDNVENLFARLDPLPWLLH